MFSHKVSHNRCFRPVSMAVSGGILCLFFAFPFTGWVYGAGSPFEIELRELKSDQEAPGSQKKTERSGKSKKRAAGKDAGVAAREGAQREGEYVRYTIRRGDHIFKVLTMHFGLSSAKAEALIPEIKRLNGISDTSRLQIGQTILLPLSLKKRGRAADALPVTKPESPSANPSAEPKQRVLVAKSPRLPDQGMVQRAVAFWERLFPAGASRDAGPGPEGSGSDEMPVLAGVGGRKIRIVSPAEPLVFDNLSGAAGEHQEMVVADPAKERKFVLDLLRAAGFATTEGGAPLHFGAGPKLSITADFTAAKLAPGAEVRKTILILVGKNGCPVVPDSLVSYLESRNLRLVAWCGAPQAVPSFQAIHMVFMPTDSVAGMADAVLDALSVKVFKDYPIEIMVGQAGSPPLSVTVDRYFDREGKRCFIDFGESDQDRATLFRLLELAGYRRIAVSATDNLGTLTERFAEALGLPSAYRNQSLVSIPAGHYALEIPGILFQRPGKNGETVFLTDTPLEQPFFDLLKMVQWGRQ